MTQGSPKPRTPAEIEAELRQARERLATNLEGLVSEAHPAAVINRTIDKAKSKVDDTKAKVEAAVGSAKGKAEEVFGSTFEKLGPSKSRADEVFGSARTKCRGWCDTVKDKLTDDDGRLNGLGIKVAAGLGGVVVLLAGVAWRKGRQ